MKGTRFFAIFMALIMVFALAVSGAMADTITLTLQNTGDQNTASETYNCYKIFDVIKKSGVNGNNSDSTLGPGGTEGYNYTISTDSDWYSTVSGMTDYFDLVATDVDTVKTVKLKSGVQNTEATAKAIAAVLSAAQGSIEADATLTNGASATVDAGYYLIKSSAGSNLVLATTNIAITEKNKYPTLTKTASKSKMGHEDTVTYTVTVQVPSTVDNNIVVTEKMSNVLEYEAGSFTVTSTGAATSVPKASITESSIAAGSGADANLNTWTWTIPKANLIAMFTAEKRSETNATYLPLVITYNAKMLDTAVEDTDYPNSAHLDYSQYRTAPSTVNVMCYDFSINKTDGTNNLTGAQFELRPTSAGTPFKFTKSGTTYNKVDGELSGEGSSVIDGGSAKITGLAPGTYFLVETKAPDGYNKLSAPIEVTIGENGAVTATGTASSYSVNGDVVTVVNNAGILFPSTGGIGTTIFYVVGGLLLLGAAIVLIARRKAVTTK